MLEGRCDQIPKGYERNNWFDNPQISTTTKTKPLVYVIITAITKLYKKSIYRVAPNLDNTSTASGSDVVLIEIGVMNNELNAVL